jgi:hypothetical protein
MALASPIQPRTLPITPPCRRHDRLTADVISGCDDGFVSKLTDIIDAATNDTESIASLLRKTKVLAARLETPPLIDWVDNELDGYLDNAPLPSYRGRFHTRVISQWAGAGNSKATVPFPSGRCPRKCANTHSS